MTNEIGVLKNVLHIKYIALGLALFFFVLPRPPAAHPPAA